MIAESVPAAEATVWTMLFSWIVIPLKPRSRAIEMTAAGMEVEKVSPALSPKNTFAAVNIKVISTPRIKPRAVNSLGSAGIVVMERPDCPQLQPAGQASRAREPDQTAADRAPELP